MPRRAESRRARSIADPVYDSQLVTQLINRVMLDGKKSTAETIVYHALEKVGEKTGRPPVEVLEQAVKTVTPVLEVRSAPRRRCELPGSDRGAAAPRRTLAFAGSSRISRDRREKHMDDKLAGEMLDALDSRATPSSAKTTCTEWRRPTRPSPTIGGKEGRWQ